MDTCQHLTIQNHPTRNAVLIFVAKALYLSSSKEMAGKMLLRACSRLSILPACDGVAVDYNIIAEE